jgi:tRNA(Ile)-lysidine synthase
MPPSESYQSRFARDLTALGLRLRRQAVAVAVSGGSDSMALLGLLQGSAGDFGFRLKALHVNHGLRGRESELDEALVRQTCSRLKVPLKVVRTRGRGRSEADWRALRRTAYARICRAWGASVLFLGQHQDDQAETVLFNLARGSGLAGASGLLPLSALEDSSGLKLARPLLAWRKADLVGFLEAIGQSWREDKSNQDTAHARNLLRRRVLPLLERVHPGAGRNLARFAEKARLRSGQARVRAARDLEAALLGRSAYRLAVLRALKGPELAEALRLSALRAGLAKGLDGGATERLVGLIRRGSGRCELLKGWQALLKDGELRFVDKHRGAC